LITEKQLIELVGAGNVSHEPATLEAYSRDMSFVEKVGPSYVVKVKDSESITEAGNSGQ